MDLLDLLQRFGPLVLVLLAVAVATVAAVNVLGRKLDRHGDWLRLLEARIGNLHKERQASWVQKLQHPPPAPLVPPPLPPRAPTIDATDWVDDHLTTEEMKQTGRYPLGKPPKGTNDDDTEA